MSTKREIWLLVLLVGALALLWQSNDARDGALDRADGYRSAITTIATQRDAAVLRAEALTATALMADSLTEAVRDSADVRIARVRGRLVVQLDTIKTLVTDTVVVRLLGERDAAYEEVIAEQDAIIEAQDSTIAFWRASSFAKDTVISLHVRTDILHKAVNDELRSHITGMKRRSWLERSVSIAAVVFVLTRG